jgi:hypothetical protein
MVLHQLKPAVPVLLGAAVCISLANVFGTLLFNAATWIVVGSGASLADAYPLVSSNLFFVFLTFAVQAAACAMGGFTAASFSSSRPYLNALLASLLLIVWYLVMLLTPIQNMQVSNFMLFIWFVPPLPMSIVGASVWLRTSALM